LRTLYPDDSTRKALPCSIVFLGGIVRILFFGSAFFGYSRKTGVQHVALRLRADVHANLDESL
jgi:hypothetical protein